LWREEIGHQQDSLASNVIEQLEYRLDKIKSFIDPSLKLDAIAARGGPLKPIKSGTYEINNKMLSEYRSAKYANHASNLGALIASELQSIYNVPAYIVDPVTVDDFIDVARISGVKGVERKSRSHALNINYCVRKAAKDIDTDITNSNFIAAHLGSGFSIAAIKNGKIIDVNDALLGMGPFSVERAGSLPISGILDKVFNDSKDRSKIEQILSKKSGLTGYLGTNNFIEIERMIIDSDTNAGLIVNAMVYQIVKEVGGLYATLHGEISALIITGGLAKSDLLIKKLKSYLDFIKTIILYPGSFELQALACGVSDVLHDKTKVNIYS